MQLFNLKNMKRNCFKACFSTSRGGKLVANVYFVNWTRSLVPLTGKGVLQEESNFPSTLTTAAGGHQLSFSPKPYLANSIPYLRRRYIAIRVYKGSDRSWSNVFGAMRSVIRPRLERGLHLIAVRMNDPMSDFQFGGLNVHCTSNS